MTLNDIHGRKNKQKAQCVEYGEILSQFISSPFLENKQTKPKKIVQVTKKIFTK